MILIYRLFVVALMLGDAASAKAAFPSIGVAGWAKNHPVAVMTYDKDGNPKGLKTPLPLITLGNHAWNKEYDLVQIGKEGEDLWVMREDIQIHLCGDNPDLHYSSIIARSGSAPSSASSSGQPCAYK